MSSANLHDRMPARQTLSAGDARVIFDSLGPAAPLERLQALLASVRPASRDSKDFRWMEGFVFGRLLHEQLGGVS